jgi:large subunit ribosomal protein L6
MQPVRCRKPPTKRCNCVLRRTLASNMIVGVSTGFTKVMEMVGTGYRASVAGKELTLNVGYSNPRVLTIPEGIKATVSGAAQRPAAL